MTAGTIYHRHFGFIPAIFALSAITAFSEEVEEYPVIDGSSGTIDLKVDAQNNKISKIQTNGADIVVDNYTNGQSTSISLQNESSMNGGTLTIPFSAVRAAESATSILWLGGSSAETTFNGAPLKLYQVKVILNQIEVTDAASAYIRDSQQKYGLTLLTIASAYGSTCSWDSTLEVNAPLLEKYFTNYRFGSDIFYHIEPVPFPIYPDYGENTETIADAEGATETEGMGEIIIYPIRLRGNITVVADRELNYYGKHLKTQTANADTGMKLAGNALGMLAPQLAGNRETMQDLAMVMDALDMCVATGNSQFADRLTAALAGAANTALGSAAMGDLERQLRAIRNHVSAISYEDCKDRLALRQIWFNAETDYRHLDANGTAAGYSLSSWGHTFGLDFDFGKNVVAGLSSTVMYGNVSAKGPEASAKGDMDTVYASLFARYTRSAWQHTCVATAGYSDLTLDRSIYTGLGVYGTRGSTSGHTFGMLYELAHNTKVTTENDFTIQPLVNISYRHVCIGGYSETGSDAALQIGRISMDTVTLGLGARMQAEIGSAILNRKAELELRFLLKADAGDRAVSTTSALSALPDVRGAIYGAKSDVAAIECGASLSIPTGPGSGSIFFDTNVETRHSSSNLNASAGYQLTF